MKAYTQIPEGFGECPVCTGTGINPEGSKCRNCGWQYQWGEPKGYTYLNKEGVPCTHKYKYTKIGRCYHQYDCTECGNSFKIDSGD